MFFFLGHPSFAELSEFTGAASSPAQTRLASHLAKCADCRAKVQTMRATQQRLREWPDAGPPAALRDRVLRSRASGTRVIFPTTVASKPRLTRWMVASVAAAALVVAAVMVEALLSPTQLADAGATSGTMTIAPAMARSGQRVQITYKAPATLAQSELLVLRARLRTATSSAYQDGVPVRTVATLRRARTAGTYTAAFTLPDSVIFAALAVENTDASVIDDHEKRTWEILTTSDGRQPSLESLDQRANDMMGRNFEEGLATTRRMVALYPDSIRGWSYLHAFQSWMGQGDVDSIRAVHRATIARMDAAWRNAAHVPPDMAGQLFWYARPIDTTIAAYWKGRMLRETPTNSFAVQQRLFDIFGDLYKDHDTTTALARFDTLWRDRSTDRAGQVAGYVMPLAVATGRTDLIDRWWRRTDSVSRDRVSAELSLVEQLARKPALTADAVARLHTLAPQFQTSAVTERFLTETREDYATRLSARRRRTSASFGRALVATGDARAGLEMLERADSAGWDLTIARSLASAAFATGDSARAWEMTARMVADPSTTDQQRDSLDAPARAALGEARWSGMRREAGRLFSQRMLATSGMRSVSKGARLRDERGNAHDLHDLAKDRVTVVAMWSRYCGWALEDLDNLADVARRLESVGSRLVLVIDDEPGPSPGLSKLLAEHKVSVRPYFDVEHTVSKALNAWGTPHYYVLDDAGRLRFDAAETARVAFARAEAVRLSNPSASAMERQ